MKKRLFSVFTSVVLAVAFLQYNAQNTAEENGVISQIAAAGLCECGSNEAVTAAGGSIVAGVGIGILTSSLPASWNPVGWAGIIVGGAL